AEAQFERQRGEVRTGLTKNERHAVDQRQIEREFLPQRELADQREFAFVLDQLEFGDAEVLRQSAEEGDVARCEQVVRKVRQEIRGRDEVGSVHADASQRSRK